MSADSPVLHENIVAQIEEFLSEPDSRERLLNASQLCRVEWGELLDRVLLSEPVDMSEVKSFGDVLVRCKQDLGKFSSAEDNAVLVALKRLDSYLSLVTQWMEAGVVAVRLTLQNSR